MEEFIVHVRLLDEPIEVWRPVRAKRIHSDICVLSDDAAPAGEQWEFAPGAKVRVIARRLSEGDAHVAVSFA